MFTVFLLLLLLLQGQAQECLLEKSMLDNRKSFLVARISAQVGLSLLDIHDVLSRVTGR